VIVKPRQWGSPGPLGNVAPWKIITRKSLYRLGQVVK